MRRPRLVASASSTEPDTSASDEHQACRNVRVLTSAPPGEAGVGAGPISALGARPMWASAEGRLRRPLVTVAVAQRVGSVRVRQEDPGMPQNFLACDREQELLLPPSLREWLPENHLAWCVI